ncbi:Hypothetical protein I595_67 [Croceitalea dokdonensis DOKDO 023]|uniref:Uncharacterized protein n=1 Tax=Croceitalea dokdonensis DOKDO 023 TaxID=1300341 RepID=A0A0P7B3P2_9FLAO|nr:Hypothetical protein I595_67 [Croceitalea dokdonensis DOKDO 023]
MDKKITGIKIFNSVPLAHAMVPHKKISLLLVRFAAFKVVRGPFLKAIIVHRCYYINPYTFP